MMVIRMIMMMMIVVIVMTVQLLLHIPDGLYVLLVSWLFIAVVLSFGNLAL